MKAVQAAEHGDLIVKMASRHATVEDVANTLGLSIRTTKAMLRHLVRAKRIKVVEDRLEVHRG